MFSMPFCRSIGMHVLLVIVFGITEYPLHGNSISANETCVNVSGEIICYFKGSEKPVKWNKAKKLCNSSNSTLPVIRNRKDQDAVAGYLKSHMNNSTIWTAGRNIAYSNWTWINGQQLKESDQVQPQEIEEQLSDPVYAALDTNFIFVALAASNNLPYICQYEGAYCNSSSAISVADKCLRLMNDSRTWYDARNQCLLTNGDLAVIDYEYHALLKRLTLNQSYWIGLRKKSWLWSRNFNAELNDEIKYTNWDSNVFSTDGEYISIDASDGKWKAVGESRVVVCQRGQGTTSTLTTKTKVENVKPKETSFTLFAVVGAGIVIIICIIVVIIFVLRSRKRPGSEIGHSKFNKNSPQSHYEELDSRLSTVAVYTSVKEPANDPVERSDDNRDDYAEIILSTLDQSADGASNQQPGIVYASLECKNEPTNLEPDNKPIHSPTKIGPLGDIYAMPDAKGHAVTSQGNTTGGTNSHPIIVTAKGDIYALPRKTSQSSAANHPGEVVYANLQTETYGIEQEAETPQ